jgi:signal transduction histidine kinase
MKARRGGRTLQAYWAVVLVIGLIFGWWMVYFYRQGDFLAARMAAEGVALDAAEAEALRRAVAATTRMLLFEGAFLGLLLLGSIALVVRALQREVAAARQQHNFLSAVTHELKSPIASARLYLESIELGRVDGHKRERYLRHAREDLDRLYRMVEQLLESARLSKAAPELDPMQLDLGEQVRKTLAALEVERTTQGAEIRVHCPAPVSVRADAEAVSAIVRNLISNAVKYGGRPALIDVDVRREERAARLCVRDHGPGLGEADGRRIFEPFVRGGDENVRTQQGVGLGLYLVGELVRASGGQVRARAADPGLAVEVTLPAGAEQG